METRNNPKLDPILRILRNWLVAMLVLYYGLYYINGAGLMFMVHLTKGPVMPLLSGLATIANMLLFYCTYAYYVERRQVSEFALPPMGRELGIGILLGFGLMAIAVLIAMVLGVYRIEGLNSVRNMLPSGIALSLPFFEEMAFRGVVFRILQQKFGSWVGLILSSLVFGGVHATNSGESLLGLAAIAFIYGPMLTAPFMVTRRLWTSIGLHGAWNYTMGAIFSVSVSGTVSNGLLKASFVGPELLTGGSAGMEGSVIGMVVGIVATVVMLVIAVRRGNIVPPPWMRTA